MVRLLCKMFQNAKNKQNKTKKTENRDPPFLFLSHINNNLRYAIEFAQEKKKKKEKESSLTEAGDPLFPFTKTYLNSFIKLLLRKRY